MDKKTPFLLSLDYELFFGNEVGTVEHCMITPTNELLKVLDKHQAKVSMFVDASFLLTLQQQAIQYPELAKQFDLIKQQLLFLSDNGHDVQLHIHPHWLDSKFDGSKWVINTERYRLHDFSNEQIETIISNCTEILQSCSHNKIFAFRAGGWCLQPFERLQKALMDNGIWLDSTVYENGYSSHPSRYIDYRNAPSKMQWQFESDPLVEQQTGSFTEIAISAMKTSPLFFWKLALVKQFAAQKFQSFGDGSAIISNGNYYWKRLTQATYGPVMVDGAKAGLLESGFAQHLKKHGSDAIFNVMGHPKSLSPDSLHKLDMFLSKHDNFEFITYQNLKDQRVQ